MQRCLRSGRAPWAGAAPVWYHVGAQTWVVVRVYLGEVLRGNDPAYVVYKEGFHLANSKSALKRVRTAERNRLRNRPYRSAARTLVKKAEFAVADLTNKTIDQEEAEKAVVRAVSMLDRVASKGIIHKNNAARRKSRLMAKYNAALATVAE